MISATTPLLFILSLVEMKTNKKGKAFQICRTCFPHQDDVRHYLFTLKSLIFLDDQSQGMQEIRLKNKGIVYHFYRF